MRDTVISLLIAAVSTFGFSILFFVHPRRLFLATFGGVLTWGAYLFACHFLEGDLLPNLLAAMIGAGFSELCARLTRVPVPVYTTYLLGIQSSHWCCLWDYDVCDVISTI